jgi:hypothetical protein
MKLRKINVNIFSSRIPLKLVLFIKGTTKLCHITPDNRAIVSWTHYVLFI